MKARVPCVSNICPAWESSRLLGDGTFLTSVGNKYSVHVQNLRPPTALVYFRSSKGALPGRSPYSNGHPYGVLDGVFGLLLRTPQNKCLFALVKYRKTRSPSRPFFSWSWTSQAIKRMVRIVSIKRFKGLVKGSPSMQSSQPT